MNEIQIQREKIRQLKGIVPFAQPHEKPEIRGMIRRNQIRLALLLLQAELEGQARGGFDLELSRKLDAIEVLLGN